MPIFFYVIFPVDGFLQRFHYPEINSGFSIKKPSVSGRVVQPSNNLGNVTAFSLRQVHRGCNGTFDHTFIVAGAVAHRQQHSSRTNMQIDPTIIIMLPAKTKHV